MRRTRHVTLPVRSWQYIGLLVVSLACLTLGHVSRDREGRHGSLAGPELQHIAPHKVDACPNISPYFPNANSDKTIKSETNENIENINSPKTISSGALSTRSDTVKNRIQYKRFIDNRSRTGIINIDFTSPKNRHRINERFSRVNNFRNGELERNNFRSQSHRQIREQRLQNERNRAIREINTQNKDDQKIRRISSSQEPRKDLQRYYRTRFDDSRRNSRVQERSRSLIIMKKFQSLNRQIRNINSEKQEEFIKRTRNEEIRQTRVPEKYVKLASTDFRSNSRDLLSSNRNNRLEISQNRKSIENIKFDNSRTRELEFPFFSREQMQKRDIRINDLNRRTMNRKNDRIQENSNFRRYDFAARRQQIPQENRKIHFRLNEQNNWMDKRVDIKRNRYEDIRKSILNSINVSQNRRKNEASINMGIAQKYLKRNTTNILNYEILQQALIIVLCTIYGTSIYNDKNSIVTRFASQVNRLISA